MTIYPLFRLTTKLMASGGVSSSITDAACCTVSTIMLGGTEVSITLPEGMNKYVFSMSVPRSTSNFIASKSLSVNVILIMGSSNIGCKVDDESGGR